MSCCSPICGVRCPLTFFVTWSQTSTGKSYLIMKENQKNCVQYCSIKSSKISELDDKCSVLCLTYFGNSRNTTVVNPGFGMGKLMKLLFPL
jgi:hypothetical protein